MTEILKGKSLAEAAALFKSFHAKVTGGSDTSVPSELEDDAERLEPLTGVKTYPARVKCATLAWHAFEAALKNGSVGATVKTE
jgi:nitrogen fixation NifU-like protein